MPIPVPAWTALTPFTAKSADLALYTTDGTGDNPQGIAFAAYKPIFFEAYTRSTASFPGASGGTQSAMSTSGSITSCTVVTDTAGYFGQTCDLPGTGYYAFKAAVTGSAGDGE